MIRCSSCQRITILAILGLSVGLPAQVSPKSQPGWVALSRYDESTSRRAFAACDEDGDDRLDVRECLRALTNMGTRIKPTGFRGLDANRNGFVHWDEFDGRYRRIVKQGDSFRFRPLRPFATPAAAKTPTAADRTRKAVALLMSLANADDDPHIDKVELGKLLRTFKQPADAIKLFPLLDIDRSGALSEDELIPVVQRIPLLMKLADDDARGDPGAGLSETELANRLGRMHPTLERWSKEIFRAADKNGDGKLSTAELDSKKRDSRKN